MPRGCGLVARVDVGVFSKILFLSTSLPILVNYLRHDILLKSVVAAEAGVSISKFHELVLWFRKATLNPQFPIATN